MALTRSIPDRFHFNRVVASSASTVQACSVCPVEPTLLPSLHLGLVGQNERPWGLAIQSCRLLCLASSWWSRVVVKPGVRSKSH